MASRAGRSPAGRRSRIVRTSPRALIPRTRVARPDWNAFAPTTSPRNGCCASTALGPSARERARCRLAAKAAASSGAPEAARSACRRGCGTGTRGLRPGPPACRPPHPGRASAPVGEGEQRGARGVRDTPAVEIEGEGRIDGRRALEVDHRRSPSDTLSGRLPDPGEQRRAAGRGEADRPTAHRCRVAAPVAGSISTSAPALASATQTEPLTHASCPRPGGIGKPRTTVGPLGWICQSVLSVRAHT